MSTVLEFLNLVYWNDNIENALLAWALPSSLSDLISKRRKLPANGKIFSHMLIKWKAHKTLPQKTNEQVKHVSLIDMIPVTGNTYVFTTQNTGF